MMHYDIQHFTEILQSAQLTETYVACKNIV